MNLENILAVSGMPGLFKLKTNRDNGLVVQELHTGKIRFFSSRKHQFTPLESVSIYTDDGTQELATVFGEMKDKEVIPSAKDTQDDLKKFFEEVLPTYDRDRVLISDIKKIIKWYTYLSENEFFDERTIENAKD